VQPSRGPARCGKQTGDGAWSSADLARRGSCAARPSRGPARRTSASGRGGGGGRRGRAQARGVRRKKRVRASDGATSRDRRAMATVGAFGRVLGQWGWGWSGHPSAATVASCLTGAGGAAAGARRAAGRGSTRR
jgi:hypothetical protein